MLAPGLHPSRRYANHDLERLIFGIRLFNFSKSYWWFREDSVWNSDDVLVRSVPDDFQIIHNVSTSILLVMDTAIFIDAEHEGVERH